MDSLGWAGLEPAQGWNENSSLGLSIPFTKLGQASAHPNEAMNSIKGAAVDRAGMTANRGRSLPRRPGN